MLSDELIQTSGHGRPTYAAVLAPGLTDPDYEAPTCVVGPTAKARSSATMSIATTSPSA